MKILIKFPTRSRPERFFAALEGWIKRESREHEIGYLITLDRDDETMNQPQVLDRLKSLGAEAVVGDSKSKVDACNRDLDRDFEILILASDDMVPVLDRWDERVADDMEKHFPKLDGALHYSDGRRIDLITLPVMGVGLYLKWGYVYHPAYQSLWCDNEFTEVAKRSGKYAMITDVVLARHDHHLFVPEVRDNLYIKNDKLHLTDALTYHKRAMLKFPAA